MDKRALYTHQAGRVTIWSTDGGDQVKLEVSPDLGESLERFRDLAWKDEVDPKELLEQTKADPDVLRAAALYGLCMACLRYDHVREAESEEDFGYPLASWFWRV